MALKAADFIKGYDETSAIIANTGNKIVALKIELIPASYYGQIIVACLKEQQNVKMILIKIHLSSFDDLLSNNENDDYGNSHRLYVDIKSLSLII